ncbi:MAG: acyltransferase [Eubacteriales bacterium]|nr:acyltransferase [Eubacteriales bacterium]
MKEQKYPAMDWMRMICAFLVVAIHTSVLSSFSETADFFLTGIVCRIAVPFFFMVSGFFLMPKIASRFSSVIKTEKKLLVMYMASVLLYLPLNIYAGQYFFKDLPSFFRAFFLDGTFYHLWYFPAAAEGILLLGLMQRLFSRKICMFFCILLYLIGLGGDSYYGIIKDIPLLQSFYDTYFQIGTYTRNGFFFAPVFLCLGWILSDTRNRLFFPHAKKISLVSFALLIAEGWLLHTFQIPRHDSMYLYLLPCMYGIFSVLTAIPCSSQISFRKISMFIYIIHPWVIVLVRAFSGFLHLDSFFVNQSLIHFLAVSGISYTLAVILWKIQQKILNKKNMKFFVPGRN